jgi:hypothetical protein
VATAHHATTSLRLLPYRIRGVVKWQAAAMTISECILDLSYLHYGSEQSGSQSGSMAVCSTAKTQQGTFTEAAKVGLVRPASQASTSTHSSSILPTCATPIRRSECSGIPRTPFLGVDNGFKGDQVRGFGFLNDGNVDTVFRFVHGSASRRSSTDPAAIASRMGRRGDVQRRQLEAVHPGVLHQPGARRGPADHAHRRAARSHRSGGFEQQALRRGGLRWGQGFTGDLPK